MKERPILFSAPMIRAVLDGRKTMTRRVVNPLGAHHVFQFIGANDMPTGEWAWCRSSHVVSKHIRCPFGQPGDRLWVREGYALCGAADSAKASEVAPEWQEHWENGFIWYRAEGEIEQGKTVGAWANGRGRWRPSIHMPRWASRITLLVKAVRVERLQDITEADAKAEGVDQEFRVVVCRPDGGPDYRIPNSYRGGFANLWQSLNAKRPGCSWEDNPFVFVVEFEVMKATEERHA